MITIIINRTIKPYEEQLLELKKNGIEFNLEIDANTLNRLLKDEGEKAVLYKVTGGVLKASKSNSKKTATPAKKTPKTAKKEKNNDSRI